MARPGLQQLLADVAARKVDVIVVYKVDRLTRSLAFTANGVATEIRTAATIARKGAELKLIVGQTSDDPHSQPDPVLLKLITLAHTAQRAKLIGSEGTLISRYSKAHLQQLQPPSG